MKNIGIMIVIWFFVAGTGTEAAIDSGHLPSTANLAKLLNGADKEHVEKAIRDSNGKISSGLQVKGENIRGKTAVEIATLLSGGDARMKSDIKENIMTERGMLEKSLGQNGFETKDIGVAYAASFVILWELASSKELPLDSSLEARKFIVYALKDSQAKFAALSEEQGYDWLMTTPVAFASLVKSFEKAGQNAEAARIRETSAGLFKKLFALPHDTIQISNSGKISIDVEKLAEHGAPEVEKEEGEADKLIEDALQ